MAHSAGGSLAEVEHVRDRLERWRRAFGRQRAIPEEIWQAAVAVARQHGVSYVARSLGLSFTPLKRRLAADAQDGESGSAPPGFVELGRPVAVAGCEIELAAADGARMTVRLAGPAPAALAALAATLWSRRA
jgi:hypothetical protein